MIVLSLTNDVIRQMLSVKNRRTTRLHCTAANCNAGVTCMSGSKRPFLPKILALSFRGGQLCWKNAAVLTGESRRRRWDTRSCFVSIDRSEKAIILRLNLHLTCDNNELKSGTFFLSSFEFDKRTKKVKMWWNSALRISNTWSTYSWKASDRSPEAWGDMTAIIVLFSLQRQETSIERKERGHAQWRHNRGTSHTLPRTTRSRHAWHASRTCALRDLRSQKRWWMMVLGGNPTSPTKTWNAEQQQHDDK